MNKDNVKNNAKVFFLSCVIIIIGFIVAIISNQIIGEWAFIPLAIVYWTTIFIVVSPKRDTLSKIISHNPIKLRYIAIAFIPVSFCIVSFVWGIQYIDGTILIILWIVFAIINSFAEELYWRGYFLDIFKGNPVFKIFLSTILFSLSHMMWGVFSITIRSHIMIMPLLIMGLTWGYVYHKTRNLKWCIIAHFFVDIMTLSVWVFLNIYIPPVI